jgi:hypothetical protein
MKPHIYLNERTNEYCVVDVPDDFRVGDLLPRPSSADRCYASQNDALRELDRRARLRKTPE